MTVLLDSLNPVQAEAVQTTEGPVLVLAGAGSGKTRVLTYKVAHLVREREVPPERILAFTFTNKAAEEMRERILRLLDGDIGGLWMGTFHATCLRILRRHAADANLAAGFSIFDRDDSLSVVKRLIRAQHLSDSEFRPRSVLEYISSTKSSLIDPGSALDAAESRYEELRAELYGGYEAELTRLGGLDFDDLLTRTLRLLQESEAVREHLAGRFRYVLVDEYQDTNRVQFELTRLLASIHRNLTVVGDDDQSIYGWRGADIRNILDFEEVFPEAKVLRLEQNYRSTQRILDAANAVVANNQGRKPKRLWTENEEGAPIRLSLAPDEEREAEDTIRTLEDYRNRFDLRLWDIAVLYRTNAQSRPFEEVCLRRRIPYRIVGGVHFFQRREVKDVLAYLRLVMNPRDEVSFERAISTPRRGMGKVSIQRFLEFARSREGNLVEAALNAHHVPGLTQTAVTELGRFGRLLHEVGKTDDDVSADEVIERVIRESGMVDMLMEGGPDAQSRRENLDELVASARHFALRGESPGFRAYIEETSLRTDIDGWDPGQDSLTLMTVHNAKGLEFDTVFITGLEEGLFPHMSSLDDPDQLEEERRLFYVALTRARRRCAVSASLGRRRVNRFDSPRPSRFLEEIPASLVETHDPWGLGLGSGRFSARTRVKRQSAHGRPGQSPRSSGSGDGYYEEPVFDLDGDRRTPEYVGRVVRHPKFGRGMVLRQDGEGDDAKCEVRFMGQITKKIMARFLDLEDEDGA